MKKSCLTNILKIILSLLIITSLISAFTSVYGEDNPNFKTNQFSDVQETEVDDLVNDTAETVVAVLRVISVAIAIVVLLVIAMKYMISAPGDRADIKKHAVAYVIGTFILFAATQIIAILIDIADKNFSEDS